MKNKLVLALMIGFGAASLHAATITLSYTSPVTAGATFDVAVLASGVFNGLDPNDALLGYGFDVITGNPGIVAYTGETAGALFTDISGQFSGTPQVAGIASNFGLSLGDFSEPLTLAVLHFMALTGGGTTISVSADLSDFNQGLTYFLAPSADIEASGVVSSVSAVPEPATATLALLAAGAMALRRRKT